MGDITHCVCNLSPSRPDDPRALPSVAVFLTIDNSPVSIGDQAEHRIAAKAEVLEHGWSVAIDKNIGVLNELEKFLAALECLEIDIHASLANTAVNKRDGQFSIGRT